MKKLNLIPACHSYIKDNPKRTQILLSLAQQCCKEQYPDVSISKEQLISLFCSAGIIPDKTALSITDEDINTTCFSIVSEYKCSFICQICPLSGRYKNALETEESALLSYALTNSQNYRLLKESGMNSKMFQALFLANPVPTGSLVATLPLNRLVYFYLECTADTIPSFASLPTDIAAAIEHDNQKKLTRDNIKSIKLYLKQLQKGYREGCENEIAAILRDHYGLVPKMALSKEETKDPRPPEKPDHPISKKEYDAMPDYPLEEPKMTKAIENSGGTSERITQPTDTICLEGLLTQPVKAAPQKIQPAVQEPVLVVKRQPTEVKINPSCPDTVKAEIKESVFLPSCFSLDDSGGYPVISISMNRAFDRETFLMFLLNHPKLAIEVITDLKTGREYLLFYGSGTFYHVSCSDAEAADVLRQFLSKSPVRNHICLDPYRLYNYLAKYALPNQNVFSLRAAYTALAKTQNRNHLKTMNEMIKELASRTNANNLPAYIFSMPYYVKMQEVMTQNHVFRQKETQKLFADISSMNTLLGISYELQESVAVPSGTTLFDVDENLKYKFRYDKESMSMKSGLYSVTYTFADSRPGNNIAMDVLYQFARKDLLMKFSYRLLAFHHDSFTIATREADYSHLCEIVANMATHIATHKGLLPLYVSEERIPSYK